MSNSIINQAVEAVMDMIDALGLFALIYRGALGTDNGLSCEVGPTTPEIVFLDKNQYIPVDFVINGKHDNLHTLTEDMNKIHESLTMARSYPSGADWKIEDITTLPGQFPQKIGREDSGQWLMASALTVKVSTNK